MLFGCRAWTSDRLITSWMLMVDTYDTMLYESSLHDSSSRCMWLYFDNDCIVISCAAVMHQINLYSYSKQHVIKVDRNALRCWVLSTSRWIFGGDLLVDWLESLVPVHQLPKHLVQLLQNYCSLQLCAVNSTVAWWWFCTVLLQFCATV